MMGLNRNVSLGKALSYRGQGPMLTFILHRIGGVGMAVFITMHILASFVGGKVGVSLNTVYENWLFQIFIFFCVLFQAIWVEWAVFLPLYAFSVLVIFQTAFKG
jgi:succinate dehydrogenase/fumarate reductase cytochrome b subunit